MADSNFSNFFNNSQAFGLNIKVPDRNLKQFGKTAGDVAGGVFEPLFTYLEENEKVFSGDISFELNKTRAAKFNTEVIMMAADEKMNGPKPIFDTKF
jgi:hypothetical protein